MNIIVRSFGSGWRVFTDVDAFLSYYDARMSRFESRTFSVGLPITNKLVDTHRLNPDSIVIDDFGSIDPDLIAMLRL